MPLAQPFDWLREKLEMAGLSQRRLSELIEVKPDRLNKWIQGTEPITEEYIPLLREPLRLTIREMTYFRGLIDVSRWRHRIHNLLKGAPFQKTAWNGGPGLYEHMVGYAEDLASQDAQLDTGLFEEEHCVKHLFSVHAVLQSASRALRRTDTPLFSRENIGLHLRYPTNHHLARLLAFRSPHLTETTEIVKELCEHVIFAFEANQGSDFASRLIRQHSAHLRVRLGLDGTESLSFRMLRDSDEIQDQRMVLFGKALSATATDRDWNVIFDHLNRSPGFSDATAIFDAIHYDQIPLGKEWPRQAPTVRAAIVRSLIGLSETNENRRLFAAQRLRALLTHSTQSSVRDATIAAQLVRLREEGAGRNLPISLRNSFEDLQRAQEG